MKYATIEIKERAVYSYLFEGYSYSELSKIFGYSGDAIKKWVGSYRKGELWTVKPRGCSPQRFDESDYEFIKSQMKNESHTTVRGMVELLQNKCCKSAVHRALTKMGYSLKKTFHADEREREDVAIQRVECFEWMKDCPTELLVFIDESAAKTNMAPLRGWSPKGERCYDHAPASWRTSTMLSSMRQDGETKYLLFDGCVNKAIFREFIEEILIPTLPNVSIIIMDNHRAHKIALDKALLQRHEITIKYLPPYSPDLNPIENMWSKIKEELRKSKPRDEWELWGKVDRAHSHVTAENAQGWFKGCGYVH